MQQIPTTRYAKSGDVHIAYQVLGEGPIDLVVVPGWVTNVECFWEEPRSAGFLRSLAAFSRLIIFDKRGTGLSDRVAFMPNLETRMDDLRAVLSAVGSQRAVLCGYSEGGPMCALFAATYPARTAGLVMLGSYASRAWRADAPWGRTAQQTEQFNRVCEAEWGAPLAIERIMPSVAQDETVRQWWGRFLRMSASPAAVVALNTMNHEIDVRPILTSVQAPALVMHARGDQQVDVRYGRELAALLPRARYIELEGEDHAPWLMNAEQIVREIGAFTAAIGEPEEPERVLATVLFSDIVGSTERAIELGDRAWRDLLNRHHQIVRQALQRFKGREVDTAGDGFFATFDGPARAVRCAASLIEVLASIGVQVRVGLHTGECETVGGKAAGIAVHIGARVSAAAGPGEVFVTSTVRDLVAGSGLRFEDRGARVLKGLPDAWHLYAVDLASAI
ncbi:MAG: adenylate/guanylate cyclase domain-containing protein [Burkholderiales bacterium]|nr:MAG: adenylate/guanylate cyclase domain-containing protein [Burkholderiales bacterium]